MLVELNINSKSVFGFGANRMNKLNIHMNIHIHIHINIEINIHVHKIMNTNAHIPVTNTTLAAALRVLTCSRTLNAEECQESECGCKSIRSGLKIQKLHQ